MSDSNMILVTGATGQIGSELIPVLRERQGKDKVLAAGHSKKPPVDLESSGPFEFLDTSRIEDLESLVVNYNVDTIYHLAGLLSATGEKDPSLAWKVNIDSLRNVLEVARSRKISRIFWPSSIAVFGKGIPRTMTPQSTSLVPSTIYGVTKVAGELLCNYYFGKYSLDVRSLRYPGIISSVTPPGGGTTDYAVEIFYKAIQEKRYRSFVRKDTVLPMMYMPDCIKGTLDLMDADSSKITIRTSYNHAGLSFSAEELANEIRKYIPEFVCDYEPDFRQQIADSWPMSIDDSPARLDWGWEPSFDLVSMTKDMIDKLSKRLVKGNR
jgi:nucleoside-diphosphate-sugar epimerase